MFHKFQKLYRARFQDRNLETLEQLELLEPNTLIYVNWVL